MEAQLIFAELNAVLRTGLKLHSYISNAETNTFSNSEGVKAPGGEVQL